MIRKYCLLTIIIISINACVSEFNVLEFQKEKNFRLADSNATRETVLLFYNLKTLSNTNTIFGHHDATAYGVGWRGEEGRSDVKDVTGSYPGLYGWDFGVLTWEPNVPNEERRITQLVREAYSRGGVNAFCWHAPNPVTDKSFYDTTIAVPKILPGGGYYLKYLRMLDQIADFVETLKDSSGNPIPLIFRPFHEFDGSWFWWGKNFCSPKEFKKLWRTTVEYLRDKRGLRNILYAYSPDRNFYSEEDYLERYPGDDYVDILGMDDYYDFMPDGDGIQWIQKKLAIVSSLAERKNKIAAFTETGLEGIVDSNWWTEKLYKTIEGDSVRIAYLMVWRNANKKHHYAPYKGHPSERNFVEFTLTEKILLERDLPDLYSRPINETTINQINLKQRIRLLKDVLAYPVIAN